MLKLQEISKNYPKTGGFYEDKAQVRSDGIIQNTS